MPISEIVLRGISRAISDINTPDGGASELINAVVENNEVRPITAPVPYDIEIPGELLAIQLLDGNKKVFVSTTTQGGSSANTTFVHFTGEDGTALGRGEIGGIFSGLSATVLGNVVIVSAAFGTRYFIYREGEYISLGSRPPFPKLAFTLKSNGLKTADAQKVSCSTTNGVITDESLRGVYLTAQAEVNKFLADRRRNSSFVFPFFVRYALRLFDGSGHILHSAPILMNPSTDKVPFSIAAEYGAGDSFTGHLKVYGTSAKLQYRNLCSEITLSELAKWKDLVTHLDIFVSSPIYSYKELTPDYKPKAGEYDSTVGLFESQYRRKISRDNYGYYIGREGKVSVMRIGSTLYPTDIPEWELVLPTYTQEEQYEKVKTTSHFYLVHSIPLSEIGDINKDENGGIESWSDVPIESEVLDSLETRTLLKDDFNSFVGKRGNSMEVYNQRLILAGANLTPYEGYPLATVRPYINQDSSPGYSQSAIVIRKGDKTLTVVNTEEDLDIPLFPYGFYYYPDADAKQVYLPTFYYDSKGDKTDGYHAFDLTSHTTLNGAYCFWGYPGSLVSYPEGGVTELPAATENPTYLESNEVYQSAIGNPFNFPLEGITSIGNTPLIALVASSIEASTGQFGDFPLYAFTEDGVWFLSITNEGWIVTAKLVSNDVCFDKSAIASLNRAVVFGSNRGLLLLEGSKVTCLSDALLGPRAVSSELPDMDRTTFVGQLVASESQESFVDFLRKAHLAFDYANNRVLITSESHLYAYVLSLSSLEFSKISMPKIKRVINHYSGVYMQTGWNTTAEQVLRISDDVDTDGDADLIPVIAVSRPIKFGSVDLKTIKRLLTRHSCQKGVGTILYGSRDGNDYTRITSRYGRSYKYFILVLYAEMTPHERISSVGVDWETRFTNKLR